MISVSYLIIILCVPTITKQTKLYQSDESTWSLVCLHLAGNNFVALKKTKVCYDLTFTCSKWVECMYDHKLSVKGEDW